MDFMRKIFQAVRNMVGAKNILAVAVLVAHIVSELDEKKGLDGNVKFEAAVDKLKTALSGAGVRLESNVDTLARFFVQGAVLILKSEKGADKKLETVEPPAPAPSSAPPATSKKK